MEFNHTVRQAVDSDLFPVLLPLYLEWLGVKNYSVATVIRRRYDLGYFFKWGEERGLTRATEITRPILERYGKHLYHYRKANGMPLGISTRRGQLHSVQRFFTWLTKTNRLLANPASDLDLPRKEYRLPQHVLTVSEVEQVFLQVDVVDSVGIRNRAILETLYSTGIRRMELLNLQVDDLDIERQTLRIRQGKGKKDRVVPIGGRALAWVQKYLDEVRPRFYVEPDHGALYLTAVGNRLSLEQMTHMVGGYVKKAGIPKKGSCHLFRHTMATVMLEHGADIRYIQQMLGHRDMTSTDVYTHVSIEKLKEVHALTPPGAPLAGGGRMPLPLVAEE